MSDSTFLAPEELGNFPAQFWPKPIPSKSLLRMNERIGSELTKV